MKAKLKSANGFTRFMLAHGEKLGMSAVVAVALLLIWKSLGRERLAADKQPTNLSEKAQAASTKVSNMKWETFPDTDRIVAGNVEFHEASATVPEAFPIAPYDPPTINSAGKRKDPELLAIEKLELAPGTGIWISADSNILKQAKLKAAREAQDEEAKAQLEREKLAAEAEAEGGRGRGGRGGRRGRTGDEGGAGRGGDRGGMAGDFPMTKDGTVVVRPSGGAPLQGFEEFRNTSWVIVKGKVPIRAQYKQYDDALATARGYSAATDVPRYMGYEVQRAEVTEAGNGPWTTVAKVVPKTLIRDMETWPIQTPDIINPKYNHPLLTFPLPPMVLRAWDAAVTHSELPLPTPEDLMGGGDESAPAPAAAPGAAPAEGDGDLFQDATKRQPQPGLFGGDGGRGQFGGRGGTDGGRPQFGGRGGTDGGRMSYGGGGPRGGFGGRGDGDGGRGGISVGMMGGGAGAYDPAMFETYEYNGQTKYLLFRYFDSKVAPGKRYRYRVQLVLKDVNAAPSLTNPLGIQEMYLENEVIERRTKANLTYRLSDWSEPSSVAVVPMAGLVFVAGAQPANAGNFNAEPTAQLLIKSLDRGAAAEVALAELFTRGSVLNLIGKHAKVMWSSLFEAADRDGVPVESPAFDFRTGLTLLDMDGGEPLFGNRTVTGPARAILMDGAGRVTIHRELEDHDPVREYNAYIEMAAEAAKKAKEQEENRGGRGGGGGGGGRGGGRGGGG